MFCPAISIFFRIQTEKKTITHRVTGEILPADIGSLILGGNLLPADIGLFISGPSVFFFQQTSPLLFSSPPGTELYPQTV